MKDFYDWRTFTPSTETTVTTEETTDLNSTVSSTEQLKTANAVDQALDQTADLISPDFKPWYAKQAYRLGVDRYLGLAAEARGVRTGSPAKVFSSSLKKAGRGTA